MEWLFLALYVLPITALSHHECDRPCLDSSKQCFYHFTLDIDTKVVQGHNGTKNVRRKLSINHLSPGPSIIACLGDKIQIIVYNKMPGLDTSIHWHGLDMRNDPFMDGTPMISQCPILPGTSFKYEFTPMKAGSYFYRSSNANQQLNGIIGPLVIRNAGQTEPDKTYLFTAQTNNLQHFESLLVNGKNSSFDEAIEVNGIYRLRLIHGIPLNCPLRVESREFRIVAIDGNTVKQDAQNEVVMYTGERYDILVTVHSEPVNVHIKGQDKCKGHDMSITLMPNTISSSPLLFSTDDSVEKSTLPPASIRKYLTVDYNQYSMDVDFNYYISQVKDNPPACLDQNNTWIPQINNGSFLTPPQPILIQNLGHLFCNIEDVPMDHKFHHCIQILELEENSQVDLFIINTGKNSNISQVFYFHGYSFDILSSGQYDHSINEEFIRRKDDSGEIVTHYDTYSTKNTVMVPSSGYVLLRIVTDNPGFWLVESLTSEADSGTKLGFLLKIGNVRNNIHEGFPSCDSYKPPDSVLL